MPQPWFTLRCLPLLALLASCASPAPIALWAPQNDEAWTRAADAGLSLRRPDGSTIHVPARSVATLLAVHRRLAAQTGMSDVALGLAETASPNAFATEVGGRRIVALSVSYLELFRSDPDALATTIGHELAHLRLRHQGARRERADTANAASQVVGTLLGLVGVPMGGTIAGLGASAIVASYSREDEREADRLGLAWAAEAGYDPCGHARVFATLQRVSSSQGLPFLASHPGYQERSAAADEISRARRGAGCAAR